MRIFTSVGAGFDYDADYYHHLFVVACCLTLAEDFFFFSVNSLVSRKFLLNIGFCFQQGIVSKAYLFVLLNF